MDDDDAFRGLAVRLLYALDLEVVGESASCAAARDDAGRLQPDAALVDVNLPDGSGIGLAADLTALPWRPRVVLISSDADAATPADVQRVGAVAFLRKDDLADGALARLLKAG